MYVKGSEAYVETFLAQQYEGFYVLTLAELRAHLSTMNQLGSLPRLTPEDGDPIMDTYWGEKEIEWDLDHLCREIDHLGMR